MVDRGHSNSFDLIRLLAALQVMASHAMQHFGYDQTSGMGLAISLFPGVPIFFAISGFLVAQSYERSASISDFANRRFARIFPGMWGALAFAALTIVMLHPIDVGTFAMWIVAQATIGQDWHPSALRSYGVGVVNGPLWSVCVEIALYVAVPFVARLGTRSIAIIAAASFAALYLGHALLSPGALTALYVTPIMWAGMFLTGTILYRLRARPRLRFWLPAFAIVTGLSLTMPWAPEFILRPTGNQLGLLNFAALIGLTFAVAFARKVRLPGDISYGIYLYHMPVLNAAVALGMAGAKGVTVTVAITAVLAIASWVLIEKPSLYHLRHRRRATEHVPARVGVDQVGTVTDIIEGDRIGSAG